jgi:hypothetical protein
MRSRSLLLAVTGLALAAALSDCGSGGGGPSADGPLSSGTSAHAPVPRGSACVPTRLSQAVAFGFEDFTNYGHTPVVLDRVVLSRPRHERLVGSYAVPGDTGIVGGWYWPSLPISFGCRPYGSSAGPCTASAWERAGHST